MDSALNPGPPRAGLMTTSTPSACSTTRLGDIQLVPGGDVGSTQQGLNHRRDSGGTSHTLFGSLQVWPEFLGDPGELISVDLALGVSVRRVVEPLTQFLGQLASIINTRPFDLKD